MNSLSVTDWEKLEREEYYLEEKEREIFTKLLRLGIQKCFFR